MGLPLIIPPPEPHTHTVVFLHGRGDKAQNFAWSLTLSKDSSGRTLYQKFPSFRWVFPQAEFRECSAVPGERKTQWFDIWNVTDFSDCEEHQAIGLKESVAYIRTLLASEATILENRWENLVLAGISQGAATSVHTLLNLNLPPGVERLGAFLGFSCRMPFPGRSLVDTRKVLGLDGVPETDMVIRNTPILLEHCVDDPLVLVENGRGLRDSLRGFGAKITWKEYQDGGHWFHSPNGMDDAVRFLQEHLVSKPTGGDHLPKLPATGSDAMDLSQEEKLHPL